MSDAESESDSKCGVCQEKIEGDNKNCEKCKRIVCMKTCTMVTACQTNWGICTECWDDTCLKCEADISDQIPGEIPLPLIEDWDGYEYVYCPKCRGGE